MLLEGRANGSRLMHQALRSGTRRVPGRSCMDVIRPPKTIRNDAAISVVWLLVEVTIEPYAPSCMLTMVLIPICQHTQMYKDHIAGSSREICKHICLQEWHACCKRTTAA